MVSPSVASVFTVVVVCVNLPSTYALMLCCVARAVALSLAKLSSSRTLDTAVDELVADH